MRELETMPEPKHPDFGKITEAYLRVVQHRADGHGDNEITQGVDWDSLSYIAGKCAKDMLEYYRDFPPEPDSEFYGQGERYALAWLEGFVVARHYQAVVTEENYGVLGDIMAPEGNRRQRRKKR